jgi:hypothetical protein
MYIMPADAAIIQAAVRTLPTFRSEYFFPSWTLGYKVLRMISEQGMYRFFCNYKKEKQIKL